MKKYKYIAVILVYRNYEDLSECIDSMHHSIDSCRIIVVNAYYDDESLSEIEKIAQEKDCDFIPIDNKGYGYGNNAGIEYARDHYEYDYIIISNPDIVVKKFSGENLLPGAIYAPKIIARSGKEQNPMVIKHNKLSEYLIYKGFKNNSKVLLLSGFAVSKVCTRVQGFGINNLGKIYQAHGSFLLIHREVIDKLHPIYDPEMFLFGEEGVLALRAFNENIDTVYTTDIVVDHKEDGSMSLADFSIDEELKKSIIYFYERYVKQPKITN